MSLLRADAAGLAALALEGTLALRLSEQFQHTAGRRAPTSEMRSWERSLPVLAHDLLQAGLPHVEVLVEHGLPLSSKRIDAVLAGQHPRTGRPTYLVVELKQWSSARTWQGEDNLVTIPAYGDRPILHPVAQVEGYCEYLQQFTSALHALPYSVHGAAYLHNALQESQVAELFHRSQSETGRLFVGANRASWLEHLKDLFDPDGKLV